MPKRTGRNGGIEKMADTTMIDVFKLLEYIGKMENTVIMRDILNRKIWSGDLDFKEGE